MTMTHEKPHAIVHWDDAWVTDATINNVSIPCGSSLDGDVVDMNDKFACLVTVAVTAPKGSQLDRLIFTALPDADGTHFASPFSITDDPDNASGYRPIGTPAQQSTGDVFRRQFKVLAEDGPRFRIHVANYSRNVRDDSLPAVTFTVTYQLAGRSIA
jgi:hypothetical protein